MVKVHVLVEGQTEEEFVRGILQEHFSSKDIYLNPIIAKTKRAIGGDPAYRGGIVSYGKIEFDLKRLVQDTSVTCVTTMIDFYRLPSDFPGYGDDKAKIGSSLDCVTYLETKFSESIKHPKFLPYISIHEFEALLFTDPNTIVQEVRGEDKKAQKALQAIFDKYKSPEDINKDNPPSKRILNHLKEYNKISHSYLVAIEIGLEKMRKHCAHFNAWITKLENLAVP